MTTRRINWTDRRRLERKHLQVTLRRSTEESASFDFTADLSAYELPGDARVCVEAYHQTSWMRFDFGTVGLFRPPADRRLTELDPDALKFRVKVLGTGAGDGRILAEAEGLHPQDPEEVHADKKPLFVPRAADLGDEVWRLVIDEGAEAPYLEVNRNLGDWKAIARSPHFIWLIYPMVLRRVLETALEGDGADGLDADDWKVRWIRFAARLPGMTPPLGEESTEDDRHQWVEAAVAAFCRRQRFRELYEKVLTGSED
jgi:hypothetical protein